MDVKRPTRLANSTNVTPTPSTTAQSPVDQLPERLQGPTEEPSTGFFLDNGQLTPISSLAHTLGGAVATASRNSGGVEGSGPVRQGGPSDGVARGQAEAQLSNHCSLVESASLLDKIPLAEPIAIAHPRFADIHLPPDSLTNNREASASFRVEQETDSLAQRYDDLSTAPQSWDYFLTSDVGIAQSKVDDSKVDDSAMSRDFGYSTGGNSRESTASGGDVRWTPVSTDRALDRGFTAATILSPRSRRHGNHLEDRATSLDNGVFAPVVNPGSAKYRRKLDSPRTYLYGSSKSRDTDSAGNSERGISNVGLPEYDFSATEEICRRYGKTGEGFEGKEGDRLSVAELRRKFQLSSAAGAPLASMGCSATSDEPVSALEADNPPPPPPDVAQTDLLHRLALLLGDSRSPSPHLRHPGPPRPAPRTVPAVSVPTAGPCGARAQYGRSASSPSMHQVMTGTGGALGECSTLSSPEYEGRRGGSEAHRSNALSSITACSEIDQTYNDTAGLTMTFNPTFSPGSRDRSSESVTSLISMSTGNSLSPHSTWAPQSAAPRLGGAGDRGREMDAGGPVTFLNRPHSINAMAKQEGEELGRGDQGWSVSRRSGRGSQHSGSGLGTSQSVDFNGRGGVRSPPPPLHLTRILFEVIHEDSESPLFIGREWLFREIQEELLCEVTSRGRGGVLVTGGTGTGKTAIIEQLVERSEFGERHRSSQNEHHRASNQNGAHSPALLPSQSSSSLASDPITALANRVVAYHYCQADNNITCTVPEFVHSVAAHLSQASRLSAYRDRLHRDEQLRASLSMSQCLVDPSHAFLSGVLDPLSKLRPRGDPVCLLLVDALDEAAYHEPDYGGTIASFLATHADRFPPWLRVVGTVRSGFEDTASPLAYRVIDLDGRNGPVIKDVSDYVEHRIDSTPSIRDNVESSRCAESRARLCSHIATLSRGSMLYAKAVLDRIERGPLVLKSANYKVLPISVAEVFLMTFNIRFQTARAFEKASVILNVCLASLYPLTASEIHEAIDAGLVSASNLNPSLSLSPSHAPKLSPSPIHAPGLFPAPGGGDCGLVPGTGVSAEDFRQRLEALSGLLVQRKDSTYAFFHPAFRDWLVRREQGESVKFLCDVRQGHALLAFKLTRHNAPLSAERVIELGHHILKAHIYRGGVTGLGRGGEGAGPGEVGGQGLSARDLQAYWLCLSAECLSSALVCSRNLYAPNVKVSRLILLAGASPDARTDQLGGDTPILCVSASEGHLEMVALLLEFGADINATGDDGVPALSHAARRGHIKVIHLLVSRLAKVNQMDYAGMCPLVHAATNGQLDASSFLLQCDWSTSRDRRPNRNEALQQSLVAAAAGGHTAIVKFLIGLQQAAGEGFDVNRSDSLLSETALTAACTHGHLDTASALLSTGVSVDAPNSRGWRPLACAAGAGHRTTVSALLHRGADPEQSDGRQGRSAVMVAAAEGHHSVVQLLLDSSASVSRVDRGGLTALGWAALKGHLHCVQLLVDQGGSPLEHADRNGCTALGLAALYGDERCVEFLLERGAQMEHEDKNGMRPLDQAIRCHNIAVIGCFLRRGAKLGPTTWEVAAGQTDILVLLLNKLMDDGNVLYKKNRIKEGAHRYQYALKKFPPDDLSLSPSDRQTLRDLRVSLLLNYSRCKRKLNDTTAAVELASAALEMKPRSFEAYHARARAKRDNGQCESALADLTDALRLAPDNRELHRLMARVKDECRDLRSGGSGQTRPRSPSSFESTCNTSTAGILVPRCNTSPPQPREHTGLTSSIPDIVPTMSASQNVADKGAVDGGRMERRKEETAL